MLQALGDIICRPWGGSDAPMSCSTISLLLTFTDNIDFQLTLTLAVDGCGGGACCWQGVDMASLRNESRATQELLSMLLGGESHAKPEDLPQIEIRMGLTDAHSLYASISGHLLGMLWHDNVGVAGPAPDM